MTDTLKANSGRQPAVIHVDLDGAVDIYNRRGWPHQWTSDAIFESGLKNMLDLLHRNSLKATLFVIADSLDDPRKRELIREAVRQGHEIASHSVTHRLLTLLNGEEKRREIAESREKIERLTGAMVGGFRAPGYLIDRECLELLSEYGYEYDASSFPTPAFSQRLEVPVAALTALYHPVPGSQFWVWPLPDHRPSPFPGTVTYSLLFGTSYFRLGLKRHLRHKGPFAMLFHLTDVADPLPSERLHGWQSRLYTLSFWDADAKIARCQKMLDSAAQHYSFTTTREVLERRSAGVGVAL